jgi:glycosyltransferase involved in cell wall biosynthesis
MILTRNEEMNLPGCLDSVAWCDDVHVMDSYSDDQTVAIAHSRGATVTQRVFDNWAAHQNWAVKNVPFKYPWVFYIDADERMTPELVTAIHRVVKQSSIYVAFRVQRRDFFRGTWLKHVQTTSWYQRLFRPEKMRYERLVNPVSVPDGPVGDVGGYLDHYPFSKGISDWLKRHDNYSTLEARQILLNRDQGRMWSLREALFGTDYHRKRFHQKELFYAMPARPLVKFLILYLGKRGFLDGRAGLTYAALQGIYEYMILLKTRELEEKQAPDAGSYTQRKRHAA